MKNQFFILLALVASITYSLSDLLLKMSKTSDMIEFILNYDSRALLLFIFFTIGLALTFGSKAISAVILAKYPLGLTQAMIISMVIVFNLLLGIIVLNEKLNFREFVGIIFIIGGIIMLNVQSNFFSLIEDDNEKLS